MYTDKNNKGVSEVLGALLIILIFTTFISIFTFSYMSDYNAPEIQHSNQFENKFKDMKSTIQETSISETPLTVNFDSNVNYLISETLPFIPSEHLDSYYYLNTIERNMSLDIQKDNKTDININKTTNEIVIKKYYTKLQEEHKYVYSHSNIDRFVNNQKEIRTSEQIIIVDNKVILQSINTIGISEGGVASSSQELSFRSENEKRTRYNTTSMTLTLETQSPESFELVQTNKNVQDTNINNNTITIEFDEGDYIIVEREVNMRRVG